MTMWQREGSDEAKTLREGIGPSKPYVTSDADLRDLLRFTFCDGAHWAWNDADRPILAQRAMEEAIRRFPDQEKP